MHRVAVVNHRVADFLNNTNIEPMPTTLQRSCVLCLSISSAGRTPAARPVFPSRLRGVATGLRFRRFTPKHRPNSPANRSRSAFGPAKPPSKCREADCSCWSCRCRAQAAEVSRLLAETSSRNQVRLGYERKLFTDSVKLSTYEIETRLDEMLGSTFRNDATEGRGAIRALLNSQGGDSRPVGRDRGPSGATQCAAIHPCDAIVVSAVVCSYEAVKKLGQAPSQPPILQGFHGSCSEPVPFFHSRYALRSPYGWGTNWIASRITWPSVLALLTSTTAGRSAANGNTPSSAYGTPSPPGFLWFTVVSARPSA
jgi:hypothetical protein